MNRINMRIEIMNLRPVIDDGEGDSKRKVDINIIKKAMKRPIRLSVGLSIESIKARL